MSITIVATRRATDQEWDSAWLACKYATYFHGREWAAIWEKYAQGSIRPRPCRVQFSDGFTAVLPFSQHVQYRGLATRYLSSPAATFGGWISEADLSTAHAALLIAEILRKDSFVWRLNPYDKVLHAASLPTASLPDVTHSLELSPSMDTIVSRWTKGHRSAVHKARREGVLVRTAQSLSDWRAYYRIYEDSLRRWGDSATTRYGWELFKEIAQRDSEFINLYLGTHGDRIIAGVLALYSKNHAVYWHGAVLHDCLSLRPVNLIIHNAISEAKARGCGWFDFNPSGNLEGVANFKRSFSPSTLPAPIVHRVSWRERILACIASPLRKLRGTNTGAM